MTVARRTSCQACHMPEIAAATPIASVLGSAADGGLAAHVLGGNAFMLGMLNKHRAELGVVALPQELAASGEATKRYLGSQAAR